MPVHVAGVKLPAFVRLVRRHEDEQTGRAGWLVEYPDCQSWCGHGRMVIYDGSTDERVRNIVAWMTARASRTKCWYRERGYHVFGEMG